MKQETLRSDLGKPVPYPSGSVPGGCHQVKMVAGHGDRPIATKTVSLKSKATRSCYNL